ncbi:MAG: hypothetical protein IKO72_02080 [Kiritimatiellae bacterium]|nr:hypothetical protein [Kiritimatiellia bacterium]
MERFLKILFSAVFFALVALPTLCLFGVKEDFTSLYGYEKIAKTPELSLATFRSRGFQDAFSESYAKTFFLRKTFLKTAYQMREWMNLGQFHYGYAQSLYEGRDNVIFERAYSQFHLRCPRPGGKEKYREAVALLKDIDAWCTSIGADFVFVPVADKHQAYPEYLPRWHDWLWNYTNYDTQAELAAICREAGVKVFDASTYLIGMKPRWEHWTFAPSGHSYNAYGSGLIYQGFLDAFAKMKTVNRLVPNQFKGVCPKKEEWYKDDDLGSLLNIWYNPRLAANPHYEPLFAETNKVMNPGSAVFFGDCFRNNAKKICQAAKLFDPAKMIDCQRYGQQKAQGLVPYAKDLKLLVMTFQSFNTGRLDERREEIESIFKALKEAREICQKKQGS